MSKWGKALLAVLTAVSTVLLFASPAQAAFVPSSGNWYWLHEFAGNNKCLDVVGAGTGNGARLQRWDCGVQGNQHFYFSEAGDHTGRLSWKLKPRHAPDKCLDAKDGLHASTPVQIWDCNSGWQQRWVVVSTTGDYFVLKAAYNLNYCLDIPSTQNGFRAYINRCDGTFGQVWSPV